MAIKFVNLTSHNVVVYDSSGENIILEIPPSGQEIRVNAKMAEIEKLDGIPLFKTVFDIDVDIVNQIPQQDGVYYIVSTVLLQALKERGIVRPDFISPNTNPQYVVKDEQGRIKGVKGFQVL